MFEPFGVWRGAPRRGGRGRRDSRRCRPTVDGLERLEARALLHAGPVAASVRAYGRVPADPTAMIEAAVAASTAGILNAGQTIFTRDGAVFVPSGLAPGKTYPLVIAFAYDGDPLVPFQVWQTQAEENHWIVFAARGYQNSVLHGGLGPSEAVAGRVKAEADAYASILPVDRSRIVLTGMSGGANYAEFMNLRYPGYAAGLIINSGQIPAQLFRNTPTPGYLTMPTAADFAGSRREAVFLCSPSDNQFYGVSQLNERTMQRLGWDTLFLNFPGGHKNAPAATYRQAIAWMVSQPSWTADA